PLICGNFLLRMRCGQRPTTTGTAGVRCAARTAPQLVLYGRRAAERAALAPRLARLPRPSTPRTSGGERCAQNPGYSDKVDEVVRSTSSTPAASPYDEAIPPTQQKRKGTFPTHMPEKFPSCCNGALQSRRRPPVVSSTPQKLHRQPVDRNRQRSVVPPDLVAVGHPPPVVQQHFVQDGFDLEGAEVHSDALVRPAAERHPGEPVALVLAPLFGEPQRVE